MPTVKCRISWLRDWLAQPLKMLGLVPNYWAVVSDTCSWSQYDCCNPNTASPHDCPESEKAFAFSRLLLYGWKPVS